jgi:hypothetical protein
LTDWWIDESRPVGPKEASPWSEYWSDFIKIFTAAPTPPTVLWSQEGSDPIGDVKKWMERIGSQTVLYLDGVNSYYYQVGQTLDALQPVVESIEDVQEKQRKRDIGKGIVQGHGPRARTTFGRGGRKQY